MEKKDKQGVHWFRYVRPYLPYFIIGPLCMIVEVIGEVLMPYLLSCVINFSADNGWPYAAGMAGVMAVIALMMMAGGVGGAYFGAKASVNFAADLRKDLYAKVQAFSFANVDHFSTGSLVTRLTNDVTQVQNMVNMLLRMALRAPGMLIGGLIMAITMRPSLAVVLAVTIPLLLLSVSGLIFAGYKRFGAVQTKLDKLNSTVQESVTNVRVVKSFVREEHEKEKFKNANGDLKQTGISAAKIMIFMSPIMSFFMNLTTVSVIWLGSRMIYDGDMLPGNLSAFLTYVTQILSSLMMVTFMFMLLARAIASAKRIAAVLGEKIDINDADAAHPELSVAEGSVEFRNVSYRYYKHNEERVLENINLTIPAKSVVGVIGSTGCGKSTLVALIPRLYDADSGEILVDGVNVKDYSLYNLREGVGMVLQNNVLFSGSIGDNLRWGNEDATDDEIIAAAESAQADQFVQSFQGGYEYDLGQGGKNVSGGQKQRLCIARALLKKPKILILDDSTSAVDTATEAHIREAFRTTLADTTKIIISQRISSVKDADMIVVMNEGQITGVGKHDELLANNKEYQEIYYSQVDRNDEREGA